MAKRIEWRCQYCNRKEVKDERYGYPNSSPCPRRPKVDGKPQPHEWTRFRELD